MVAEKNAETTEKIISREIEHRVRETIPDIIRLQALIKKLTKVHEEMILALSPYFKGKAA
jgi:hypothetical protein